MEGVNIARHKIIQCQYMKDFHQATGWLPFKYQCSTCFIRVKKKIVFFFNVHATVFYPGGSQTAYEWGLLGGQAAEGVQ